MDMMLTNYEETYTEDQLKNIKNEFKRVKDTIYLDHAGATLYSEIQIQDIFDDYKSNLFANPHARNTSSKLTEDAIDQIRYELLKLFNTNDEEYSIIFTSGATAALKIVAESFQYDNNKNECGVFAYLYDNHTSVLGMREYGKNIKPIATEEAFKLFSSKHCYYFSKDTNNLFAYPAQSNFSGIKYPLEWIKQTQEGSLNNVREGKWYCLLDAASYVSTNKLDLKQYKPDFVPLSFYKIFGYPTGLGALLVKNSSIDLLKKKYFGGGTVLFAMCSENIVKRRKILYERFEDGTLPFLAILSLRHGLNTLKRLKISMEIVSQHVFNLAKYVYYNLLLLHHFNGKPVIVLYHSNFDISTQGGIINFNILRSNGEYVGFAEVLNISNLHNIHIRTGCFCNPGACQSHLKLSNDDIKFHFSQGHVCGDQHDLINGVPTGSIRISFGYMSSKHDADRLLEMLESCFVEKPLVRKIPEHINNKPIQFQDFKTNYDKNNYGENTTKYECTKSVIGESKVLPIEGSLFKTVGILQEIYIYPIKSCAAYSVNKWQLISTGLKYDRQWMIVNSAGVCLTQKKVPYMCLIRPKINTEENVLELHFEGVPSISIPLDIKKLKQATFPCQSKVCGDRVEGWDCGNNVSDWFYETLNISGLRLIRQRSTEEDLNVTCRSTKKDNLKLSLTNQAQFLLINSVSAEWLLNRLPDTEIENLHCLIKRFRPNFVVKLNDAFVENSYKKYRIGNLLLTNDGPCTRCQMICINQDTGEKSAELLLTLSKEFCGKVNFGTYLKFSNLNVSEYIETKSNIDVL